MSTIVILLVAAALALYFTFSWRGNGEGSNDSSAADHIERLQDEQRRVMDESARDPYDDPARFEIRSPLDKD
ncbi:hypothetical protein H8Z72_22820 (plasmid) [Xanthomonas citri pv. citri]|uniref:hypothetical protein n=1 Tax=Xanthomonas citri TaxID=346 RepID=UPI00193330BF|nr:hypothetical protein [Xanthomonas citri]QRD62636.1 hypothetical protein H8Z74_23365 [Xanthomonas citri pv. citri]QRD67171.1 hypothetical protein H8Z73_22345 [Xanthomonas citri pv. citri]QRD71784.1 hypothetical protein H8Z72_22820 [Xanthomonas citri pv. citri]